MKIDKYSKTFDISQAQFPLKKEKYPDPRNWKYKSSLLFSQQCPDKIDLSNELSAIKNQGQLNSCQSFAAAKRWEHLAFKKKNWALDASELFVYWNTRARENTTGQNVGAYLIDAIKAVVEDGVALEAYMPYSLEFTEKPPVIANIAASFFKIFKISASYYKVSNDPEEIMKALAEGNGIIFGAFIYESFLKVGKTGLVSMPGSKERNLGGHAMYMCGYDKTRKLFKVANSWGEDMGDKGYYYIPFEYIKRFGFDLYIIL